MTNDATTNVGFKGAITSAQTPFILSKGTRYGVEGAGDLKVTAGVGTRALSVAAGTAWGDGVRSTWNSAQALTGTAVASSGYRWDTVYVRRTWQPGSSPTGKAEIILVAGTATKAIAGRTTSVGVTSGTADQPIALVRFDYNVTTVTEIVDLRVWASDSGMEAASIDALQYITNPGTHVGVGDVLYRRVVDPGTGAVSWKTADLGNLAALELDGALARLQPSGAYGTGMQFTVADSTDSIYAQKPGPGGPVTTFGVNSSGVITVGNLNYGQLIGETSQDSGFGTNLSGYAKTGGTMYRRGDQREMYLKVRSGFLRVVDSKGQVGDLDIFTLLADDCPRGELPMKVMYRGVYRPNKSDSVAVGEQGALVSGMGYINSAGRIRFTFGSPNYDVLPFTEAGTGAGTTFYIHAQWGV